MNDDAPNPLLALGHPLPFDVIRPEHIVAGVRALLQQARERLNAIATDPPSLQGTLEALDTMTEPLDDAMAVVSHLESVSTTPELRAAYGEVQPEVSAFYSSIPLSEPLWSALRNFAATDEAKQLQGERRRFLEKTLANFRRQGAELDAAGKAEVAALEVELGKLTLKYAQNVLDATEAFEFLVEDEARLAGLPPSALAAARQSAEQVGKSGYRFTLQAPSYLAAMTYLEDGGIRERLYRAYHTRATRGEHDNRPILRRILELRRRKARLLGYRDFADLILEDRMARSGDRARRFVADLRVRTEPAFEREKAELLAFRRQIEGEDAPPLAPWDVSYYAEKMRRALYDLDEEALRPYFPADRVMEGMFIIAKYLYGISIVPWEGAPTWHPSVRTFEMRDERGQPLAHFYADIYPRASKRDGAWMHGLRNGYGGSSRSVAVFAGNLTPPLGDKPALLTHREVETLFHEFGHLLHHTLSRVELRSLAGTNVAWDFVELPSQMMENWCWEREALDLFARHVDTGDPLPDALLDRMRRARTFRAASAQMRQLGFAEVDLALHIDFDPASAEDPMEIGRTILERHSPTKLPEEYAMLASFSHLFASPVGYAAGYYSYKWAEVLDADAFALFQEAGIFNRVLGERFRQEILERGDSEEPGELFRRFRGRDPEQEPLLRRLGLLEAQG
ncbi:MAG: M3 family metallopeptidase [Polyangiaceae bacterium]|nr:M3 family metallopeptidase [Polyangiaceae bacterium]